MSLSPPRSVTDELIDMSKLPFALGTPARERAARLAANRASSLIQPEAWRSPKSVGVDRSPWHASKIVHVLRETLAPAATIEILLHGSHCLFLCASETRVNRDKLRSLPALTALATHIFDRADDSHSGARVKEHTLNSMTMLLGEDASFDNFVAFDAEWLSRVLPTAMTDRHAAVVIAASRFVRRLSEVEDPDDAARQIVVNDALFSALLQRYETCEDVTVRTHILCAFVNVTSDQRVHFFLARCQRLLQILLDEVFSGSVAGTRLAAARWASEVAGSDAGTQRATETPRSVVRPRPGLSDVSPLHRYVDRSRTRGITVTGTPRIAPNGVSPSALNRSGATSVVPVDPLTPKRLPTASTIAGVSPRPASGNDRSHKGAAQTGPAAVVDESTASALMLCDLALRTFINLLSSEDQCAEIRRLAPTLLQATVDCRSVPDEAVAASATELLRLLHDLDSAQLDHEVAVQVLQGRALAQQLRSRIPVVRDDVIAEADWYAMGGGAAAEAKLGVSLALPDFIPGGTSSYMSGRSTLVGSEAPTAYSSRGMGSAVSLVRRALAEVKSIDDDPQL